MGKQNLGGVYANMDFPPYVWTEYPKHITTGPHGKFTVVHSPEEEQQLRMKLRKDHDEAPAEVQPYITDPAKEILISRARELGVPFNSKWSKMKLEQVVKQAEDAVDDLPPEMPEGKQRKAEPEKEKSDIDKFDFESDEEYKARLILLAKNLGIQATHLWGIPRLKMFITEEQSK